MAGAGMGAASAGFKKVLDGDSTMDKVTGGAAVAGGVAAAMVGFGSFERLPWAAASSTAGKVALSAAMVAAYGGAYMLSNLGVSKT